MELVGVEILLVALIQLARLQLSCQTSQVANVPFKTSFVATSDYVVRRNGALTSSVVGELPHQVVANEALLSEPTSFETSSTDERRLPAAGLRGRGELSWLSKSSPLLGAPGQLDGQQSSGQVRSAAENGKQLSVLTYEVDASPSGPQERPRLANIAEPQRGQEDALAEGSYGHSNEDLLAAPSGADTSAEPEAPRSQPTDVASMPSETGKTNQSERLATTTTSSVSPPTSKAPVSETPQTIAPSSTTTTTTTTNTSPPSSPSSSSTSAPPTTTTTTTKTTNSAAATAAPTTIITTTTTSNNPPNTVSNVKLDASTMSAGAFNWTQRDSSTPTSGNATTGTAVALAPTTSTPMLANNTERSVSSETTTMRLTTSSPASLSSTTTISSKANRAGGSGGGGDSRREAQAGELQQSSGEAERFASSSMETFASNRSTSARSSQCKFDQQQSGCNYLVKTVPVVDRWGPSNGNSSTLRVVNEFVLVPEDSALSADDSSYPIRRQGSKEPADANLNAEHRTIDGEGELSGDDVELDYLSPDSETLKSVGELIMFGKPSSPATTVPPVSSTRWTVSATSVASRIVTPVSRQNASVTSINTSSTQITPAGGGKLSTLAPAISTTSGVASGFSSSSSTVRPTTRVSQSFTIRVSPISADTGGLQRSSSTTNQRQATTSQSASGNRNVGAFTSSTATSFSGAPSGSTTRKPQVAPRMNQKILRIGTDQHPDAQPVERLATTTTTTTTSTTTTSTTTTRRPTAKQTSAPVEQRQKSAGRVVSSRHRQYFSEPVEDLRRRPPTSDTYSPLANGADEEEANIMTRYTIPSQLSRISSIRKMSVQVDRGSSPMESSSNRARQTATARQSSESEAAGRRIQLAASQKFAANQQRTKQNSLEREQQVSQRQKLDQSNRQSKAFVDGEAPSTDKRQVVVVANRSSEIEASTLPAEREFVRVPVGKASGQASSQVSGRQPATSAKSSETRATGGGDSQSGQPANLNRLAGEQKFLANQRNQQSNSNSRKMPAESLVQVNATKPQSTPPPTTTTTSTSLPTTTTISPSTVTSSMNSLASNVSESGSNSIFISTTSKRELSSRADRQQAAVGAQRKQEVMTLIASSSNVNQIERSSQSSLLDPVETSTPPVDRREETRPPTVATPEPAPERQRKPVSNSKPPVQLIKQVAAVNRLQPERVGAVRAQRGGLSSSADEYEGSIEDQLAKDALHNRPRAAAPKRISNAYTGSRHLQTAKQVTMDSGKWLPSSDELAASLSNSASINDETGQDTQSQAGNLLPGRPGIDYPIHWQVPKTSFDCRNYEQSGFYADVESDCQAYHSCHKWRGGRHTFLCPNGTLFSQELLTCDWWYNVECSASKLYLTNETPNGPAEKSVGDSSSLSARRTTTNELSKRRAAA